MYFVIPFTIDQQQRIDILAQELKKRGLEVVLEEKHLYIKNIEGSLLHVHSPRGPYTTDIKNLRYNRTVLVQTTEKSSLWDSFYISQINIDDLKDLPESLVNTDKEKIVKAPEVVILEQLLELYKQDAALHQSERPQRALDDLIKNYWSQQAYPEENIDFLVRSTKQDFFVMLESKFQELKSLDIPSWVSSTIEEEILAKHQPQNVSSQYQDTKDLNILAPQISEMKAFFEAIKQKAAQCWNIVLQGPYNRSDSRFINVRDFFATKTAGKIFNEIYKHQHDHLMGVTGSTNQTHQKIINEYNNAFEARHRIVRHQSEISKNLLGQLQSPKPCDLFEQFSETHDNSNAVASFIDNEARRGKYLINFGLFKIERHRTRMYQAISKVDPELVKSIESKY